MQDILDTFLDPPHEYTLVPFWLLNDELDESELRRQIDEFQAHGVYAFIPHPRIGLPESISFVSSQYFHFLRICVEHAAQRGMFVFLYDEGMYPSGSCSGQVVAENPIYAARCIQRRKPGNTEADEEIIFEDSSWAYVHCRSNGTIRGLHWGTDDGEPNAPPAADLLNPEAMACFRRLVLDRHYDELGKFFGDTIRGFFTDEPSMLGRNARKDALPWTWGFETVLEKHTGADFRPHLPALFDASHPDHLDVVRTYNGVPRKRLIETYYAPYSAWCESHQIALTGHPAGPCDIEVLRYFHIPGQDVVWRYVEPFKPNALEGEQSTMAKCSASAQRLFRRKRNLNECFGAYGWEFSYDEMKWITNWLLVRGVNLLVPHAFYYSIRGERRKERPPDVGPNSPWWKDYKRYADFCRRMCWLLSEGEHICDIAVLGDDDRLPWDAARILFETQHDFTYINRTTLLENAEITPKGVAIGNSFFSLLIVDGETFWNEELGRKLSVLVDSGRVVAYGKKDFNPPLSKTAHNAGTLEKLVAELTCPDVRLHPKNPGLRYIHIRHELRDFYIFANEAAESIAGELCVAAETDDREWWDPETGKVVSKSVDKLILAPYQMLVLACARKR